MATSPYDAFSDPVPETPPAALQASPWDAFSDRVDEQAPPATPTAGPAPGKGTPQPRQTMMGRVREAFTGESRTEFPDAGEFAPALERVARERGTNTTYSTTPHQSAIGRSSVTPDVNAQVDILRSHIPGLETKKDTHGNVMLRAPGEGVTEWTYLNAPGVSRRDAEELATQTVLTAPLMGAVGIGSTLFRRALIAAGLVGGGEVVKDLTATAVGSEQGVDPVRATVASGLGAVTAPGVPSALVSGVARTVAAPFQGVAATARGIINPEREAVRRVGTALERDEAAGVAGLTDADRHFAAQSGQPIATIDHGGNTTRGLARAAANSDPEAHGIIERFVNQRFETQGERVGEYLAGLTGPPASATASRTALGQTQQRTLPPLYERAYQQGRAGVHTPELEALEQSPALAGALRRADESIQSKQAAGTLLTGARGPTGNPTLEYWDQVVRALADDVGRARTSGAREEARDLAGLRNRLLTELDQTFSGYANARGTAATFFRAGDALEAGEAFATQHWDIDAARAAVQAMAPAERETFRQGFASRMLERLNSTADRRSVVTQITGSRTARDKLEIALGRNAAREMEAFMRIETLMDAPRGAMGNSTTLRQFMELGLAGGGLGLAGLTGNPTDPSAMSAMLMAAASFGARRAGAHIDRNVMNHIATVLTSQDPAVRQRALQAVARGRGLDTLRRLDRGFTGIARGTPAQQTAENVTEREPDPAAINAMASPAASNPAPEQQADLPLQSRNAMAANASPIPRGNAMAGTDQSGTEANPIPVRTRADVERVPSGAYVINEAGEVSRRR